MAIELEANITRTLRTIYRDFDTANQQSSFDLTGQSLNLIQKWNWQPLAATGRLIGTRATLILLVIFVAIFLKRRRYLAEKMEQLKEEISPPAQARGALDARWQEVRKHLESYREPEWKFAVIEADKIVEDILAQAGFPGDTLGGKLMAINKNQLASIDDLWAAHKLRNLLAHDPDYQMRYTDAREAIANFEKALRELGALAP